MVARDVFLNMVLALSYLSPQVRLGSIAALLSDLSLAADLGGQIPEAFESPASGPGGQRSYWMPGVVVGGYNLRSRRLRQRDHGFEASLGFTASLSHFGPGSPGLESTHTSLHPGQETEALPSDTSSEATVQSEQGLGAPLSPQLF